MRSISLWAMLAAASIGSIGCGDDDGADGAGGATNTGGAASGGNGGLPGTGGSGGEPPQGGSGGMPDTCESKAAELQMYVETKAASYPDGGLAIVAEVAGCPRFVGAAGDAGLGNPVTSDYLFRIGSISKTYTAAVLVDLADKGQLSLDDTLDTFNIQGIPNANEITVRQLLQHTSGLNDYSTDVDFVVAHQQNPVAVEPQSLVDQAVAMGALFAPGTDYQYSNTNFVVAGLVIEAVTGGTAGEAIHALTDPLALDETFLDGEDTLVGELVPGFSSTGSVHTYVIHPTFTWTAGGMVADVDDVADWIGALHRGQVMSAAATSALTDGAIPIGGGWAYGLGTIILPATKTRGASIVHGHNGAINGYRAHAWYFPGTDTVFSATSNWFGADLDEVLDEVTPILFQ